MGKVQCRLYLDAKERLVSFVEVKNEQMLYAKNVSCQKAGKRQKMAVGLLMSPTTILILNNKELNAYLTK